MLLTFVLGALTMFLFVTAMDIRYQRRMCEMSAFLLLEMRGYYKDKDKKEKATEASP